MNIKTVKGVKDILPDEVYKWRHVENEFSKLCECFGYKEIRLPVFEHTELFERGVGDTTDIVQKEMYTFLDKGGRSITLRPEGTAGVVRSYIQHSLSNLFKPQKLFYNITAYRYENTQKGRYREFHQFGVEAFGAYGPEIDVEIISMFYLYLKNLGIKNIELNINSIGCPSCRGKYNEKLNEYLKPTIESLCDTCKSRYQKNTLRILDCKDKSCIEKLAKVPSLIENLCTECNQHFEKLKQGLGNLNIEYKINKNIVRGLDYYTKTVFEFVSTDIGAQGTICGGGRYDGLVETCGGPKTPGIGFALGVERLLLTLENQQINIKNPSCLDYFIVTLGENAEKLAQKIAFELRSLGKRIDKDLMSKSLKAQMKYADKIGTKYCLIIGDNEIENAKVILKDMRTGEQSELSLENITEQLNKRNLEA